MGITSLSQANAVSPPGMVLVAAQSFSAASTVSVDGCFTDSYTNYRIIISNYSGTVSSWVRFRLRASGSDTTSNYKDNRLTASSSVTATVNPGAGGYITIGYTDNTSPLQTDVLVCNPQAAVRTTLSCHAVEPQTTNGVYQDWFTGVLLATTQFDGFTIYPDSGTITGTLAVYGLRKAL